MQERIKLQRSMTDFISLADFFSFLNAFFGFTAIAYALEKRLWISVIFILLAALSDGADGILARKFGEGKLGEYLDTLSDTISFFAAPSIITMSIYLSTEMSYINLLMFSSLLLFLFSSLLRLSSFYFMKQSKIFLGLPIPTVGVSIALLDILGVRWYIFSLILAILSLLMITKIPFPKVDKKIGLIASILIFGTLILRDSYNSIAPVILLLAILIYIILGPFVLRYSH